MSRAGRSTVGVLLVGVLIAVAGPASAEARVQVTAGGGHTCAIKIDATIVCWGLNNHGQATPRVGTFSSDQRRQPAHLRDQDRRDRRMLGQEPRRSRRHRRPGTFRAVSAGGDHSCGLRTDGTLACWGRNTQSPPFNVAPPGTLHRPSTPATPRARPGVARSRTDGDLACWGYNSFGRGNPPPGSFSDVGAGGTHGCALALAGTLACWGGHSSNGAPMPAPPGGLFSAVAQRL